MVQGFKARSLGPRAAHMPRNHPRPMIDRVQIDVDGDGTSSDPLARDPALALLEAVLLIADEPLPLRKLAQVTGISDARRLLKKLQELYDGAGSAFELEELAGGYQLMTRPEYHRWLT